METREEAAFAWVEQVLGGRILSRRLQSRWRNQWFLEVERDGAIERVVLRGFRNPGYTAEDTSGARAMLALEAQALEALQDVPVATPRYLGSNPDLGWMLMEWLDGDSELTQIADEDRRFAIYQGYVEELATLHAYPLDKIRLPAAMPRPASSRAFREELIARHEGFYRSLALPDAEPVLELGLQWVKHNDISSERPLGLGLGDVGPNQFLFVEDRFHALVDFEYAVIGDPLMEMGMMRGRDVTYHTGRMTEHMRHYGACYERLTGIPLDLRALQYWTIAGPALWNVYTVMGTQRADPAMIDLAFLFAYEVQQKRCILEGIAEYYGFRLTRPELPKPTNTLLSPLTQALAAQLDGHFREQAGEDPYAASFARYSASIARTLALGDGTALMLETANREELGALLGHRIGDWRHGLRELEALIAADWEKDLERRVNMLYRCEVRREYLYEPMQRATGVSHGWPMSRFDV